MTSENDQWKWPVLIYPFAQSVVNLDSFRHRGRRVHLADEHKLWRFGSDDVTCKWIASDAAQHGREVALDHENATENAAGNEMTKSKIRWEHFYNTFFTVIYGQMV